MIGIPMLADIFWLTAIPFHYILQSGMNTKLNSFRGLFRKTLWMTFILVVGISFSAGGVMADSCRYGAACMSCTAAAHPHMPGVVSDIGSQDCQPIEPDGSCGFQAGSRVDQFDKIASFSDFSAYKHSGIFTVSSNRLHRDFLRGALISPFQYPCIVGTTPIFLRNHSLRC
jgi:hypothetical protein